MVISGDRPFVIIGERINPTGRKVLAAEMKEGVMDRVRSDAAAQAAGGAHMLDVNAGIPAVDEPALLVAAIRAVMDGEVRVPPSVVDDLAAHLRPRSSTLGADLTPREREVLALLAKGRSTNQMVDDLVVSVHTVRNHIRNILTKLQARSRLEAVAIAIRLGLVETDEQVGARRA